MKFLNCIIYLAAASFSAFIAGRFFPKHWFDPKKFPYKCFNFEHNGKIYEQINIKLWQNRVPDMSKIFPSLLPPKKLTENLATALNNMICETCIAEFTHVLLGIGGFFCMHIWNGAGGAIVSVLYALGNLPFIFIQRYNRPRFIRLQNSPKLRNAN